MAYRVFVRNWWKRGQYGQLVPDGRARKYTLQMCNTIEEALAACEEYNSTHKPGVLSRKAEFTKV
jgi:hypothetical protein